MTEILAPAGGREQLAAAVRAGADAVYLGLKEYSARAGAENFGSEELCRAVSYCHARNVKVHVALNTLIKDGELKKAAAFIESIAESGADAVIIQDLAVARMVARMCPELEMHASTQMAIHNADGVKRAAELGFSRAVLARELEFSEIEKITESSPIETEVFIHGALCMCISGMCFLSSAIGGRSGNRGRCAQPCRLDFKLNGRDYALSLKDMSAVEYARRLADAGVSSLKIEGRMKRPEYVACAVKAVRDALNGAEPDVDTLRDVFSRGGFTDEYLSGKRSFRMFGVRSEEDVRKSAATLGRIHELYRRERQSVHVDMELSVGEKLARLTVSDGYSEASAETASEAAIKKALDETGVKTSLSKLGDTPFYLRNFKCEIKDGYTLRASALNSTRREAAAKLLELREKPASKKCVPVDFDISDRTPAGSPALRIRAACEKQIEGIDADELVLPMREIINNPKLADKYAHSLICELPPVLFEKDTGAAKNALFKLKSLGVKRVLAENIGALSIALEAGFDVHGGAGLNIMNSLALGEYARMGIKSATLSFETSSRGIAGIKGEIRRGIIAYGYLPLMRMRACPAKTQKGCENCSGVNVLTDRKNAEFTLVCHEKKYSELLNSVPLYVGDRLPESIDFATLYFTAETHEKAKKTAELFKRGLSFGGERTGGLYFREID